MAPSNGVDGYTLPRDKPESSRLNQQHNLLVKNTGYLLHDRIRSSLPDDASIAEIATGTGIWLKDVALTAPSGWSFTGFDISPGQFPPGNQEGRCKFEQLNIFEPLPSHLEGAFNVVHIRYLVIALAGNDWNVVAQNARRMLKPGGWLQWHEGDFHNISVMHNVPGASTVAQKALHRAYLDLHVPLGKCLVDAVNPGLLQTVMRNGYEEIDQDVFAMDRIADTRAETVTVGNFALLWSTTAVAKKHPVLGYTEKRLEELHRLATEEAKDGKIYITWKLYIVTARKPLQ